MKRALQSILMPLGASVFAILIGGIIVAALGYDPVQVYGSLLSGAFVGSFNLGNTLAGAIPLILAGLGVAVAFRAGLFNIGAEGQYWMGAVAATWCGIHFHTLPGWLHTLLCLAAAMVAGALWGGVIPGLTKAYLGAHEVITTMMLSYISVLFVKYLLEGGPLQAPGTNPQSPEVDPSVQLTHILPPSQLTTGLFIALIAAVLVWWLLQHSTVGFQLRAVGFNQRASRYAGIRVPLYIVLALGLSGMLAGLAGAVQLLGVDTRLYDSFSAQYGYTAIVVALLARNHPFGVILAAIFFSALNNGGQNMQQVSGVPASLTDVLTGLIVFFVAAERLLPTIRSWFRRRRRGQHTTAMPVKGGASE
jgi:ABC-type uncharacterized transport system permease subunit